MRKCTICHEDKPITEFGRNGRSDCGAPRTRSSCRACDVRRTTREYKKGPGARASRRHMLKKRYGLTEDSFAAMLASQGGRCAVCARDISMIGYRDGPYVDHCHASGRLRSLLCNTCNRGLGMFGDDPSLLEAAAAYLRKHQLPS